MQEQVVALFKVITKGPPSGSSYYYNHGVGLFMADFDEDGLAVLAQSFETYPLIKTFYIDQCSIDHQCMRVLIDILFKRLSFLHLAGSIFDKEGCAAFSTLLVHNRMLVSLELCNNALGNDGAIELANALCKNETLQSLNLDQCEIGDSGACALAKAICKNVSLVSLSVNYNPIGKQGTIALAAMLKRNRTLQCFSFYGENSNVNILTMVSAFEENGYLRAMYIGSQFPSEFHDRVSRWVERIAFRNLRLTNVSIDPIMQQIVVGLCGAIGHDVYLFLEIINRLPHVKLLDDARKVYFIRAVLDFIVQQ